MSVRTKVRLEIMSKLLGVGVQDILDELVAESVLTGRSLSELVDDEYFGVIYS